MNKLLVDFRNECLQNHGHIIMIKITSKISVKETEIEYTFIRAPGPGGQNVNKVATAVQLRFNVSGSSLPEEVRARLLMILGKRITTHGDLIIKANRYRTQSRNKQDALDRFLELLKIAATPPKKRKKTKLTKASVQQRLNKKKLQSKKKSLRRHDING